jgi:hypothetical protein
MSISNVSRHTTFLSSDGILFLKLIRVNQLPIDAIIDMIVLYYGAIHDRHTREQIDLSSVRRWGN